MPTITELVNIPTISDPTNFSAYADDFLANQLPNMVDELNAAFGGLTLISTTDTSSSSVLIGTGAKTFIVTAGKSFYAGMPLTIADTAAPSTNAMYGTVTSYSGTSLVMDIKSFIGSGTKTAWSISLAGAGGATLGANSLTGTQTLASGAAINESISTVASATTPDIWTATSNNINYTGTTTATGFAAAPQAGVTRTLILAAAASFTAGANMIIDGVVSFTGAAGDEVEVTAITTTQFRLRPKRTDGKSIIGGDPASNAEYQAGTDPVKPLTAAVARARNLVSGTAVATTSGTSHDFTGIPSWVKRIVVMLSGISTNGTSEIVLQLGDSGGIETTNYGGSSMNTTTQIAFSTYFSLTSTNAAASVWSGCAILNLLDSATNTWAVAINTGSASGGLLSCGGGSKALSGTLDRIRITTGNGTDVFDAGSLNIIYE
jgi:hypothetical protein